MAPVRFGNAGRDNNLNLIRAAAAIGVLVSHAWPITHGKGNTEPLQWLLGASLGTICVYLFFALSGFLITASYQCSGSGARFVEARVARLFPGLAVSLVLVAFVLGPWVTSEPAADYLADPRTWTFLSANLTLLVPQYSLPGVFSANPYPDIEGSIWSLAYEVAWYGIILMAGMAGLLTRASSLWLMTVVLALWAILALDLVAVHPKLATLVNLGVPFVMGGLLWLWRDRVPVSGWIPVGLGILAALSIGTVARYPALIAFLTYGGLWLAYVPAGWLRQYNRLGDYSYGIYIYAFPMQGLVMWLLAPDSVLAHILLAAPATILLAVVSWHLIEHPALQWQRERARGGAGRFSLKGPIRAGEPPGRLASYPVAPGQAMIAPIRAEPVLATGRPFWSTE